MNTEQEKLKTIYIGYHPRTHDGSSPQSRPLNESIEVMEAFNEGEREERFQAELVEIACTDLCAVAVMEKTIGKVWQYI